MADESPSEAPAEAAGPERAEAPEGSSPGRPLSDTQLRRSRASWSDGPPALHVGRVLAERWEVGERIGMGGMASVHRGVDRRLERAVAVKILHPHIAENPDARTRLAREAKAIAQLKHESVIEVYDYDIGDPDCTWLVTELIEGFSLRQALDKLPKPMPEVGAMIVTEVLRALRAAHEVGVVHRDVKPDNVLVGLDGRPKLSDFGIAQVVTEERMTLTGNLVGSPSYMSPEQAEGRRTDHRTDLFSAGILLYRLVTGKLPFAGQNAIETLRLVARTEMIDPAEHEPQLTGAIAGVIRKALAPDIGDRYQSADEMLADLGRVLMDCGLSATADELPRFFRDPEVYEVQLALRLSKELAARGRALVDAGEEARGLDCLNRAIALGANQEHTFDLVKVISGRRERGRLRKIAITAVATLAAATLIVGGLVRSEEEPPRASPVLAAPTAIVESRPAPPVAPEPTAPTEPAPAPAAEPEREPEPRRAPPEPKPTPRSEPRRAAPEPKPVAPKPEPPPPPPPPAEPERGTLQLGVSRWVDVYVDDVRLGRAPDRSKYSLPVGEHRLRAINPHCNPEEKVITIRPEQTTRVRLKLVCP